MAISGVVVVAGTATQLPDRPTTGMGHNWAVQAHCDNADTIHIGGAGVTAGDGFCLDPGEAIVFNTPTLEVYYAVADVPGDELRWIKLCGTV